MAIWGNRENNTLIILGVSKNITAILRILMSKNYTLNIVCPVLIDLQ